MITGSQGPEMFVTFKGSMPTDRMAVFGITAMVSYPGGWIIWTADGVEMKVPTCVGQWLAGRV